MSIGTTVVVLECHFCSFFLHRRGHCHRPNHPVGCVPSNFWEPWELVCLVPSIFCYIVSLGSACNFRMQNGCINLWVHQQWEQIMTKGREEENEGIDTYPAYGPSHIFHGCAYGHWQQGFVYYVALFEGITSGWGAAPRKTFATDFNQQHTFLVSQPIMWNLKKLNRGLVALYDTWPGNVWTSADELVACMGRCSARVL